MCAVKAGGSKSTEALPFAMASAYMLLKSEMLCNSARDEASITCCVCHGIYENPKCHGDCGHFACANCWTEMMQAGRVVCPACRCPLRAGALRWNAAMESLMGAVRIKCS